MKYLILACAILVVMCSKSSCINNAQSDQVPFKLVEKREDIIALPIPLMEQPVIQPSKQIVLARGSFTMKHLYDFKTNSICVEPFLALLSSVISNPCELVFDFHAFFYVTKLISYMCQKIKNSEHVGNVYSVVVKSWFKPPSNKDFAAFKSMLVALPNLKKLQLSSHFSHDILTLSIFNCVKHLESAKLNMNFFELQLSSNYMDYLKYFASSHPNLKELDLLSTFGLKPKEVVFLIESMQLNSFLFELQLANCSAEDVDAINRLKFKRGLKSLTLKPEYDYGLRSTQNADKFLFGFALKLDCLEELSIAFGSYWDREKVYSVLSVFLYSLPHPELLTKLRIICWTSSITFDADIFDRFINLKELDLVNISFNTPKISFQKLRTLKFTNCEWKGCLASAFPSVANVSLLGFHEKSHGCIYDANVLFGCSSVNEFTIALRLEDYSYFCKNVVKMKIEKAKFNGKLNIKLEIVKFDFYCNLLEDEFANLTIDIFNYFDSSFVKLTIDNLYATAPMLEKLVKNVGKLNLIHVNALLCRDFLPLKKDGENLTWESEYYDTDFKQYMYKNFTCANK